MGWEVGSGIPQVDFGSRFPPVSETFPTPGGPRGFEESLDVCSDLYYPGRGLSPNGDRYIHIGSLSQGARAGRLNCRYISDGKVFLLHRSALN